MNKRQKRRKRQQRNQTALRAKTVLINEPPKKETTMHKSTLEFLAFLGKAFLILLGTVTVLIAVFGIAQAWSNPTDWHNHEISEQISQQARAEARKLWREENGDWQPNLTPQAEQELLHYTAQKQAEIDRTFKR
ncbi:hypothetical protein BKK51_11535 [Rodentibacter trehalosifermentans]|uniref:Uncharacterized protein n=1 Tax=Rodentibacter trehalosifermentans TaxID=1908263 RepID=A0A1V3IMQ3_9PAST|nr:hypothetical protein [Rodentibacter trehalosifermentans]OOF43465.1 hypothetical protein BKK51_11535 [Rodentibacter trehalosifermentans]